MIKWLIGILLIVLVIGFYHAWQNDCVSVYGI